MTRCIIVIAAALMLTGCSGSSDSGGTSGGVGDLTCRSIAGTYPVDGGGSLSFRDNCEFTFSTPEGDGRGEFTVLDPERVTMNLLVTTGPSAGCRLSIDARVSGDRVTELNATTRDCG